MVLGRKHVIRFLAHLFSGLSRPDGWLPWVYSVVCEDYIKGTLMPLLFPIIMEALSWMICTTV